MLCREIIAVCSQIHARHINTLCGQNVRAFNAVAGDEGGDSGGALKGQQGLPRSQE